MTSTRAVSPILGVALLVALTVAGAAVLVAVVPATVEPIPTASIELSADSANDSIRFDHRAGEPIDVDRLGIWITVDDDPLAHQPPVPFFQETGFRPPDGQFNSRMAGHWTSGENGTLRLAGTNDPLLTSGATVEATVAVDGTTIATLETTAD